MKRLIFNCVTLGFFTGFLIYPFWKNDFLITSTSDEFISILAFVFLSISFLQELCFRTSKLRTDSNKVPFVGKGWTLKSRMGFDRKLAPFYDFQDSSNQCNTTGSGRGFPKKNKAILRNFHWVLKKAGLIASLPGDPSVILWDEPF